MLRIISIISCLVLISSFTTDSIYTRSVTSIEGVNKPLNAYQGKKMLIITLPVEQNNSNDSLLHSLDSIKNVYGSSLIIIGVPAYEDGYTPALKSSLTQWYRSILSMDIIVTEGLYTRKTSGNQQHSLFKWLTDKDKNGHFNIDVEGPSDKFIVWTDGQLVGVLGSYARIGGHTLNNLLQQQ